MPTNEELEGQLKIQQDINKVLSKRAGMLEAQSNHLAGQARLAKEVCKALECKDLDNMEERLQDIQKGFKGAAANAGKLKTATEECGDAAKEAEAKFDKLMAVAAAGAAGAVNGFKGAISSITSLASAATRVAGTFWNIGKAVVAIPFKMLNGLVGMASKAGGGAPVLKQAWEEVRKTFGSLSEGMGGALKQGFDHMIKQSKNLAGTGKSLRKLYGVGKAGLAEAVKELSGRFAELGASASRYSDEVKSKHLPAMAMYNRALYNSAEDLQALDHISRTTGKSMTESMGEFANQTIQMASKFGLDRKQFSKDMMAMAGDAEYFGGVASTELAAMTVYIHKLGMEAKSLKSLIDKWDNFESAAEGASKLAQSFGMNVDAMAMMNEQNPAKRMDMLRDSFFESGKAVEDLTRAEKKLLAEQMGLADVADLEKALADPSMSYDDIQAEADANEEAALTQEQAMSKLADSLDRVFGSGGGKQFASFGDALMQGFMKGMSKSKEFKEMLKAVRCALYNMYLLGKSLGEAFAGMDSVKGVFKSIADLFNSFNWKEFREGAVGAFTALWEGLEKGDADPVELVGTFLAKLKEAFFGAASEEKLTGVKEAFKQIGLVIGRLALGMVPHIMEGLAKVINAITEGLKYMMSGSAAKDGEAAITGAFANMDPAMAKAMEGIKKTFKETLEPALKGLWAELEGPLGNLGLILMGYIFGKTVFGGATSMIMMGMTTMVMPLATEAIKRKLWPQIAQEGGEAAATSGARMAERFGTAAKEGMNKAGRGLKTVMKPTTAVLETGIRGASAVLEKTGVNEFGRASKTMFKQGLADAALKNGDEAARLATSSLGKFGDTVMRGSGKMAGRVGGKIAALGTKAIPFVGWAVLIADGAVGMSKQMEIAEGKLQEDFGELAGTAGAGAQGVVEFLTLGLMPQPMLDAIGSMTAKAVNAFGSFFDMLGLKGVYDLAVAQWNMIFKLLAGIGDILIGLFTGDGDKLTKGFQNMFEGVWGFVKRIPGALVSLLVELPWTILKFLLSTITFIFIKLPLRIIKALRELFTNMAKAIYEFFTGFWKEGEANTSVKIGKFFEGVWQSVKDGFFAGVEAVYTYFSELWEGIKKEVYAAFGIASPSQFFADVGTALVDGLWSILTFLPRKFLNLATQAWQWFKGAFPDVAAWASGVLTNIWDGIKALPDKMLQMAKDAWSNVTGIFDAALDLGKGIVDGILNGLGDLKDRMWEKASAAWDSVTGYFGFSSPAKEAESLGGGITDGMMNGLAEMSEKVKQPFIDAWNYIREVFSPTAILEHFMGIFNAIYSLAQSLWDIISWPYVTAWNWIAGIFGFENFQAMFMSIFNAISGIAQKVFDVLSWPYKQAWQIISDLFNFDKFIAIGGAIVDGIIEGIGDIAGRIGDKIGGAVDGVKNFLGISSPSKLFAGFGGFMSDGMLGGLSSMKDDMVSLFDNVMGTIRGMFDNVLETFGITTAVDRILEAFIEPREIIDALTREYDYLAWGLGDLTHQIDKIANMISGSMVDRVIQTVDMISEIVENYNEINDLLAEIDPINLDARIDRLGQNLSLSRENITIRNKPINISVNLHATIDGKRLATELSSKGNGVQLAVQNRNGTSVTHNVG